jgi:hypothetical protein
MFKKTFLSVLAVLFALSPIQAAGAGQPDGKGVRREERFDPVEFIQRFKIGMSYTEAQAALPKEFEQDILSYITSEEVFMLSVDIPGRAGWNASFKFDTLDTPLRRPERLIEMSCSASLSNQGESFDSFVGKLSSAFGEPVTVERAEGKFQQAGWRVGSGSVLMLEYSTGPNSASAINVEFIIKKNRRREAAGSKAVA